jgi:hypothetical protein
LSFSCEFCILPLVFVFVFSFFFFLGFFSWEGSGISHHQLVFFNFLIIFLFFILFFNIFILKN